LGLPVHHGTGKETEVFDYQEQRMKFLTRIEQEAKELEINGFLHNSRGTNKIDSTSSNIQQEQIPVIDLRIRSYLRKNQLKI
jgi:hypothetical protein